VSKSTVCRSIWRCLKALVLHLGNYVKFPSAPEFPRIKTRFYDISEFPGVIGLIDCTHVRILSPNEYEHTYVNRKSYHSFNVQCICDADGLFTNINAKWPGSTHDSRIFNNSPIKRHLEANPIFGYLLGDSGYACKPYLLTPFIHPTSLAQERYNAKHRKTRVIIEQVFGRFKRRFSILHSEIRVKTNRVPMLVACCAILHNIAVRNRLPDVDDDDYTEDQDAPDIRLDEVQDGLAYRLLIAERF